MGLVRQLGKGLLWAVIAVVALIGVLLLVNAVDENLQPEVAAALKPAPAGTPDDQNAFFVIAGFEAPAGQDPHEYGRRWLAEIAAANARQMRDIDNRYGRGNLEFRGLREPFCRPESEHCFDKARRNAAEVRRLVAANEEPLWRYESLWRYPRLEDRMPRRADAPLLHFSTILKAQSLKLAQIALMLEEGRTADALDALGRDMALQRKFAAGASLLVTKAIALVALSRDLLFLSEVLQARRGDLAAAPEKVRVLAAPLGPGERRLGGMAAPEFQYLASLLRLTKSGDLESLLGARAGVQDVVRVYQGVGEAPARRYPVPDALLRLVLKENATLNLSWPHYRRLSELGQVPPGRLVGEDRASAERVRKRVFNWRLAYNPVGKLLFAVGAASWAEYFRYAYDVDGLSRLVALQAEAVLQGIPDADMPRFLATSGRRLFDLYREQPMQWDAAGRQIWFKPASSRMQRYGIGGREGRVAVGL